MAKLRKNLPQPKCQTVTVVIQSLAFGGAETFWLDLLVEWREQGKQLHLYISDSLLANKLRAVGFDVTRLAVIVDVIGDWKGLVKALVMWPLIVGQYWRIAIRERQTNVLIMSGFSEKIILTPLAALYGIPVVWIEFAKLEAVFNKFWGLPKLLYGWAQRGLKLMITPTVKTGEWLVAATGWPANKIVTIVCGRAIAPAAYKMIRAGRQSGLALSQPAVVCISRLEKGKGQDLLIRAWPKVLVAQPGAQLYIVGSGDFAGELRQLGRELKLGSSLHFLGMVPDALAVLAQAQVSVFPSRWELEGFGLALIEAMALGVPVVAFSRHPITTIITHQENGLLASDGSSDQLATHIIQLLKNKKLGTKLAHQARLDFQKKYAIGPVAEQYLKVLETVCR